MGVCARTLDLYVCDCEREKGSAGGKILLYRMPAQRQSGLLLEGERAREPLYNVLSLQRRLFCDRERVKRELKQLAER